MRSQICKFIFCMVFHFIVGFSLYTLIVISSLIIAPVFSIFDTYFEIRTSLEQPRKIYDIILFLYGLKLNSIILILHLWMSCKNITTVFNNRLFILLKTCYNTIQKEGLFLQIITFSILHGIGIIIGTYIIPGLNSELFLPLYLYFVFIIISVIICRVNLFNYSENI
jgi:hypothetical protein